MTIQLLWMVAIRLNLISTLIIAIEHRIQHATEVHLASLAIYGPHWFTGQSHRIASPVDWLNGLIVY